ncbi:hypothetical protein E2C01_057270 [Portunus trituberculatus]|uniref:Uncharacterized protein n=1 Tax=Portunus trituberculatus TaxID=210409 RepID=A0A5B7H018_PORTR|nr:hypothetical protein [Portunus trituberculatus]
MTGWSGATQTCGTTTIRLALMILILMILTPRLLRMESATSTGRGVRVRSQRWPTVCVAWGWPSMLTYPGSGCWGSG